MKRRNTYSVSLALITLVFAAAVFGQRASIRTADGYLFIQNGKDISFTCEVKGKEIKPLTTGENPAFMADGMLIQIIWVPAGNFEPTGKAELPKLLEIHRVWETDYLKTVFETTVKTESETLKIANRDTLFWSFKRPKYTDEYDRDAFMTTLVGRNVFGINSPVRIGVDLKTSKDRMIDTMKGLKTSPTPFDVMKLADEIKRDSKQGT